MKLITEEEKNAHWNVVATGGIKGFILGSVISAGIFTMGPHRYPRFLKLPWSIKTAIAVTPPIFIASVNAELCSSQFDYEMYSSETSQKRILEEHQRWNSLTVSEKLVETLNGNKYPIITGLWALSMWGSWVYVNRDPLLTKTQKFVQARMYAQFLTVGLLLASMGLSMYEEKLEKTKGKKILLNPDDEALQEVLSQKV